jgi:type IV pilus assembly protein PilB
MRDRPSIHEDHVLDPLADNGYVTLEEVGYERAARIYAFSVADLEAQEANLDFIRSTVETFTEDQQEQLFELGLVPHHVQRSEGRQTVILITYDPMRPEVHRVARSLNLSKFELQYAPKSVVNDLLSEAFPKDNEYLERIDEESAVDLGQNFEEEEDLVDEEKLAGTLDRYVDEIETELRAVFEFE